ncbi:MAG: TlpA disulfide reductase family protein [Ignavibacteriales bacterium]|nr:TlpA disulfide reductase family protein [Ignavibacteriales bacterium]
MRKVDMVLIVAGWFLLVSSIEQVCGQVATFSPQNPKIGDVVTAVYNPVAQRATILRPSTLTLQALILPATGVTPVLVEIQMEKSGKVWKGNFTLDRKDARFLLYQFVAGDLKDDNVEKGWSGMVLGPDGKELEGARYWRGVVFAFGGQQGFKHRKDVVIAKADIAKERRSFPDNFSAVNLAWYLETNPTPTDAAIGRVKRELNGALEHFRKNEEALPMILVWYEQTGLKSKADSLRTILVAENSKGRVAFAAHTSAISKEKDPLTRTKLLEQFLVDFPMKGEELLAFQRQLLMGFVQTAQYEKGYSLLKSSPKMDPALYQTLTSAMIETGVKVEKAVDWLAEGVEIARQLQEDAKPPFITSADWKKNQANTLAGLLRMRGVGLVKLGRNNDAEPVLVEAYGMKHGEDLIVNENLINAYVADEKFKEAEKLGRDCVRREKSNLKVVEKFKIAYKNVHGSLSGYDKTVKDAKLEEETALLKRGINKPVPDFSLKDTSGTIVKLSDLRGRVVVLDCWSTWSVPCNVSLSQFQKVFERYESYKTVAFVALNTSENITGPKREAAVKKFMADSKLTFPVVYDNGLETAQKFGIEGIPTTIVIDRNGNIQFVSSGSKDGNEPVNDLINQIEVLLKH